MAQLWHKIAQDKRLIRLLITCCIIELFIIASLCMSLSESVKEQRCFGVNGLSSGHLQSKVVPQPIVFDFAYRIWQDLNHWSHDGEEEYKNNITTLRAYLTSEFRAELENDYNILKKTGELRDRERALILDDLRNDEILVKPIGNNLWEVNLTMQLVEHIGKYKVKNVKMSYPLLIEKRDISIDANQWGLAIAGFAKQPKQLSVLG